MSEGFSDSNRKDGQNLNSDSVNKATEWTKDDWRNFIIIILLLAALVFLLICCRNNFFSKSSPNIISPHPTNSKKGLSQNFTKLDDVLSVKSNNIDSLAKTKCMDDNKEIKRGASIEYPDDKHHLAIKSINTNQRRNNVKVNPIMSLDQIEKKIVTEIRDYKLLDSSKDEISFEYLEKYYKYFLSYSDKFKKNLPIFEFAKSLSNDSIRYAENGCYKHSKVELKGVPGLEINANYIPDRYGNKRFIATEAPKNELACAAFWHMIYEKRCEIVVSLVDIFDVATSGCDYMPEIGKTRSFRGLEVSIVGNSSISDNSKQLGLYFISRTLRIRNSETGDLQVIKHLQFSEYPDKLQPEHPAIAQHFIDFLDDYMRIRQSPNSDESGQSMKPIVVHCLAGLNRSMWLISSVTLLNEMRRKGQLLCDPLSQMVFEAQMRRNCISDGQTFFFTYSFLRNAMDIEAMQLRGMSSIRRTLSDNMRKSLDKSQKFIRKLENLIVCEFNQHLEAFRRRNNSEKYMGSPLSVLISDNEEKSDESNNTEPFLNASKIPGETKNDFILAQNPQKSKRNQFWKAVCEKNCTTITLLEDIESSEIDENIDDILPTENSPIVLKKFLIHLVSTKTRFNGKLLEKTLRVTDTLIQEFQFEIKVFVVTNINIKSFCNPENLEFIIQAIYPQYAMEFQSNAMKIKMTIVDQKGAACATQLALLLTFMNHLPKISRIKPFHSISLVALFQCINCKRPKFFESTEKLTAIIENLHRLIEQHS
ncbi:MAG: C6 finger domain-containing protein, variant [Marteilia pararefringens]